MKKLLIIISYILGLSIAAFIIMLPIIVIVSANYEISYIKDIFNNNMDSGYSNSKSFKKHKKHDLNLHGGNHVL